MKERRYLYCATCDDSVRIIGEIQNPAIVFNFLELHTHKKEDGSKHVLVCCDHEYVFDKYNETGV